MTAARDVLVGAVDSSQMGVNWGERRNRNFRKEENGRLGGGSGRGRVGFAAVTV